MEACCSRFTAAEGGARLAAAAATKNILAVEYASFIPVRLLYEKAFQIRGSLSDGRRRSAYVTRASRVHVVGFELKILTDLAVAQAKVYGDVQDWLAELETKEVIVCTAPVLKRILELELLSIANVNVMILDSCHMVYEDDNLKYIMQKYRQCNSERPLILALTYPLFASNTKDIEKHKDIEECKEISERDNSVSEVCATESEETQIANENGENRKEIAIRNDERDIDVSNSTEIAVADIKTVQEATESNEIAVKHDKIVTDDLNSEEYVIKDHQSDIDESNCTETAITDKKTVDEAKCMEISQKNCNIENEESHCTDIAIRECTSEMKHANTEEDDAITKKLSTRVSRSIEEIGVYENLDDFDMYEKLEWKIEEMEKELCCHMDLAEDIDGGKRLTGAVTKPREVIIEYSGRPTNEELSEEYVDLEKYMRDTIKDAMEFINDHRHDPTEIYGEELYEEFINIPDPTIEPAHILNQFLYILDQLGPYAADKAAFSLLTKLEKLKIKIPYERHFLLLCLCTTVFVKIRCYADSVFSRYENDWDKIRAFCTLKVLRFAEILEMFQPPDFTKDTDCKVDIPSQLVSSELMIDKNIGCDVDIDNSSKMDTVSEEDIQINSVLDIDNENISEDDIKNCVQTDTEGNEDIENNDSLIGTNIKVSIASKKDTKLDTTSKMLSDIEHCDFASLGNRIQDRVNTYEANLKDINDTDINDDTQRRISDTDRETTLDIDTKSDMNTANTSSNVTKDISDIDTKHIVSKTENLIDHNKGDTNSESNELHDIINCIQNNENTSNTKPNEVQNLTYIKSSEVQKGALHSTSNTPIAITKPSEVQNIISTDIKSYEVQKDELNLTSNTPSAITKPSEVQYITNIDGKPNEVQKGPLGFTRRAGHRVRGRTRVQRNNAARIQQLQLNPDALCGIVYMKEALMAKILFMLIVDMSRGNPRLGYLCAQYCAAPPGPEPRDCQRQGKKQEEVLKKFRMHECNLLLATSALEEGIDLPRCNLVLRWDVPPSYRSYGSCRTRARAARATAALLCSYSRDTTLLLLHNLAIYRELDQIISRKCGCGLQDEPPQTEEEQADMYSGLVKAYTPNNNTVIHKNDSKENNDKKTSEVSVKENNKVMNDGEINDIESLSNELNDKSDGIIDRFNDLDINDAAISDVIETRGSLQNETDAGSTTVVDTNEVSKRKTIERNSEKNNTSEENNDNTVDCDENNEKCIKDRINTANDEINYKNNDTRDVCNENIPKLIKNIIKVDIETNIQCNKCNYNGACKCCISGMDINVNKPDIRSNNSDIKNNISDTDTPASVDLNTAIALINRYCGKLPSDTFTRLAPQWWTEEVVLPVQGSSDTRAAYICTLRLPLNCPVKYNIVGHPMPTKVLARRMVALQACRILHKSGELDNQLMPIGKENFKAADLEAAGGVVPGSAASDPADLDDTARPGTTKRRQYYYKRTAWAFTDCQPIESTDEVQSQGDQPKPEAPPVMMETKPGAKRNMLYAIVSRLWCALPERYNTRGRRLHAPQLASQAIGILMARHEPDSLQIPAFPVYTRSGEVRVSVAHVPGADVALSPRRAVLVRRFMRFVFAEVLRVRRRGMKLQSEGSTHNNYYVVPTIKTARADGSAKIDIDWAFLELIYQHTEDKKLLDKPMVWQQDDEEGCLDPVEGTKEKGKDSVKKMENPLLKPGETFLFDAEKYREAVVTPWYRNQDQPQFFLVAEICGSLTPDSAFPSATHSSFREYYTSKYGVTLTQAEQPLLDVDHTSARLNLLTPRYVNRKGVALPVSSERTRRAKRDRLDQKQILVPELCRVHPFAAPLWFATVALPCVLYRINALLIADEIRRAVAIDVGLGIPKISESTMPDFQWPPLDFGWSLAEVLNADTEKSEKKKEEEESKKEPKEIELSESVEDKQNVGEDDAQQEEKKEKTINDILQEKEDAESGFEIGTWSNDMASAIPPADEYDEYMEPLPPNLTFCTSASGGANWYDPIEKPKSQFNPSRTFSVADSDCSFTSSDLDSDDSDLDFDGSDEDTDTSGFCSSKNSNAAMGVRIEYKTAHEAEAVDLESNKKVNPAPLPDPADDADDREAFERLIRSGTAPDVYIQKFRDSVAKHKEEIISKGHLITRDEKITQVLPTTRGPTRPTHQTVTDQTISQLFPYTTEQLTITNGQIDIESIEKNKRILLNKLKLSLPHDDIKKLKCFSMVDIDIDAPGYVNEKLVNVGFDTRESYEKTGPETKSVPYYEQRKGKEFDFDYQPTLEGHPGPSPSVILQALTMSNANDGINLERLETIGDSFLKFAITAYLYCAHPTVHEGKLSHMRSKQVSNLNLYRLGRSKRLGARMIASKFEPHDNWLPPCHKPPHTQHQSHQVDIPDQRTNPEGPAEATGCFIPYNLITQHSIPDKSIADCVEALIGAYLLECGPRGALLFMSWLGIRVLPCHRLPAQPPPRPDHRPPHPHHHHHHHHHRTAVQKPPPSPASPKRQRSSSTSSECSSSDEESALRHEPRPELDWSWRGRRVGSLRPYRDEHGNWMQAVFGELKAPPSPLLRYIEDPEGELDQMLSGYDALERTLQYRFKDRSLLLQAMTHASHHSNRLTDCYQRLEFLGDAILDYLITRHLYEDPRRHSPGALTDLRSALVNNTIFATLAARHGFHKYFRHMSPGLNEVLTKYVKIQEENGHSISEEHYLIQEDEMEQAEDVEVPKALGDLFESVAGAIFLDSGMSLDAVWKSYVSLMGAELEAFSAAAPKSPVRELLEAEPDTAKFGKPERLADGRRVRVCVEVFGRGAFKGVGRNYRIAKGTAARCALRHLRARRPR